MIHRRLFRRSREHPIFKPASQLHFQTGANILATPPFLSQQEIDRRLACTHAAKIALDRIVEIIREAPEASPSRELRRFLWSLFNDHPVINLWSLRHALDRQQSGWASEVFTACLSGHVSDELLRQALSDSGEMEGRV